MKFSKHPVLLLVSAPSGAGKTTLCQQLLQKYPELSYSVSCTTRAPRTGECDGEHYHFLTRSVFEDRIACGDFLEYAEVYGNYYGTLVSTVAEALESGRNVLMDVDVQGAGLIRQAIASGAVNSLIADSFVDVFVCPPSLEVLRVRLTTRGQDSSEVIERRMSEAEHEMVSQPLYAYTVVNDELDAAAELLGNVYCAARQRTFSLG